MSDDLYFPCRQHHSVQAGWRCDGCKSYLCPDCTARVLNTFYCVSCEQPATQLSRPRADSLFVRWVLDAFAYPFWRGLRGLVLLAVLIMAANFAVVKLLDPPPPAAGVVTQTGDAPLSPLVFPPLRALLVLLYGFAIVSATARGGALDRRAVLLHLKAGLATLILALPAAAYMVFVLKGLPARAAFADPMPWLFLALAVVYLPMALAGAASDAGALQLLNPFRLFAWASRAGRQYWWTVLLVALFAGLAHSLNGGAAVLRHAIRVPLLARVVSEVVSLAAFTMMARLIGSILWVRGDAFDWGTEASFRDPVLRDDARGTRRRKQADGPPDGGFAPSFEGPEAVREKPEAMLAKDVINALGQHNNVRALKLYESRRSWSDNLFNERQRLDLGTAALNASKLDIAEALLETLTEAKGPLAGRAMMALAKVYEQMGNQSYRTRELYRQVVQRFPGTDMARAAGTKLGE